MMVCPHSTFCHINIVNTQWQKTTPQEILPSASTHTLNCNTNLRDNAPTTCCAELNTSALISLLLYCPQISVVNKFIFSVTHKYYKVTDMKADI